MNARTILDREPIPAAVASSTSNLVRLARARAGLEPATDLPRVDPARASLVAASGATMTHAAWYDPVERLSASLRRHGLHSGDRVLILSETRLEWMQADLAIMAAGGISVPAYPALPAGQLEEILGDSGATFAFVSNAVLLQELLRAPSAADRLRTCILFPAASPPPGPAMPVLTWEEAIAEGGDAPAEIFARIEAIHCGLGPDDPATLIYTSGTAGRMKGVPLTHGNLVASAIGSARRLRVSPEDVYLSFLPLAHVLERVVQFSMLWAGARIVYSAGLDRLEGDFKKARPTIVVGVPRLYEKVLRSAADRARRKGPRAYLLFRLAEHAALQAGRRGPGQRPRSISGWIWNALVYRKIRRALGGRTRMLISGGAPLGTRELLFFNGAGLTVLEGYGLTETASVLAVNTPEEWRRGSVGRPLPGVEVRIADDGEIAVRGPSVLSGYWNDENATRTALQDGWLATGDLGRLDEDGFLYVTDRKKDLIVTAHGKKVAPQLVETRLRQTPLIHEAVVTGDRRPYIVALIYPELEVLRGRLGLALPEGPDLMKTLGSPSVRALFRAEIDRVCEGLAPHEQVRDFALLPGRPGIADGSLTPTQKLRRAEIETRHAAEIRAMYQSARR